jgi:hypothetical protein
MVNPISEQCLHRAPDNAVLLGSSKRMVLKTASRGPTFGPDRMYVIIAQKSHGQALVLVAHDVRSSNQIVGTKREHSTEHCEDGICSSLKGYGLVGCVLSHEAGQDGQAWGW